MAVNVEVAKNTNENTAGLIRRFTKRVQESGILMKARSLRYFERAPSQFKKKSSALNRMERGKEYERLKKYGKELKKKGRRR